jgi:hypothetical protein
LDWQTLKKTGICNRLLECHKHPSEIEDMANMVLAQVTVDGFSGRANEAPARLWAAIALIVCVNALASLSGCAPTHLEVPALPYRSALFNLAEGSWVKIHQQRPGDAITFKRQRHGGSAFDTRRGQLVLFGSDTHDLPEYDWINTPFVFDVAGLAWHEAYVADPVLSYRVDVRGLPVAGPQGNHPWAMHTFGAVTYDPARDAVVVASYPAHLEPGRFNTALAAVWPEVRRHPTWLWHPGSGKWEPLAGDAVHFFPYATAYDAKRGLVLGYRSDGIYALQTTTGKWRKELDGGLLGWANNVAFDTKSGILIAYGSHRQANDVVVYDPASGLHRKMPTTGKRPPGASYVPMAFHRGIGRTVVLIDRPPDQAAPFGVTETWLYDYPSDSWAHLERADLPFAIGMNYNLEYDPGHRLLLLVATPPDEKLPAVWALSLRNAP